MKTHTKPQGPKTHRFLIYGFSAILTILLIWLLGFMEQDIGNLPGPKYEEIEKKYVDASLTDRLKSLEKEKRVLEKQIANQREIQSILRTSTDNSQQTMNQLLEKNRLNLAQGVKPTEAEQNAMAESQTLFLSNQKKFQEANRAIAELSEKQRENAQQIEILQDEITAKRKPAEEEFEKLRKQHLLKVASLKLACLIPLFLLTAWPVIRKKGGAYAPILYSAFIATFWQVAFVMHNYFPMELFKYIAVGVAIIIVIAFLVRQIRIIAAPKLDWLLKQYKEAYNKHRCPVCAYPIERGLFKNALWTSKGPKFLTSVHSDMQTDSEQPYTCPACGETLFEKCEHCGAIRHSFLPYCLECGKEKISGNTQETILV